MSDLETKQLNLTVPLMTHQKLEELSRTLGISRTSALVMAVNEYHAKKVRPGLSQDIGTNQS